MADPSLAALLAQAYEGLAATTVMEVCGTHTHAIARQGLCKLLPPNLRLVSGPGCPVCVTDAEDIRLALALARLPGTVLFSFGDMLRVPVLGPKGEADSLYRAKGLGSEVRMALSPMDALAYAQEHPCKDVIWFGVGFETTAPHTAALILKARERGVKNLSVLCAHKTMPAALLSLLWADGAVDGLLCPGHVAVITGAEAFDFLPRQLGLCAAIAGFEAGEIGLALAQIAKLRKRGIPALVNCYPQAVTAGGNPSAQALLAQVFVPCGAKWRGLGEIPGSGLALGGEFGTWDARLRFGLSPEGAGEECLRACRCADVLRGAIPPRGCSLFGSACNPDTPYGPCMVSAEGACSAAYLYGEE